MRSRRKVVVRIPSRLRLVENRNRVVVRRSRICSLFGSCLVMNFRTCRRWWITYRLVRLVHVRKSRWTFCLRRISVVPRLTNVRRRCVSKRVPYLGRVGEVGRWTPLRFRRWWDKVRRRRCGRLCAVRPAWGRRVRSRRCFANRVGILCPLGARMFTR